MLLYEFFSAVVCTVVSSAALGYVLLDAEHIKIKQNIGGNVIDYH